MQKILFALSSIFVFVSSTLKPATVWITQIIDHYGKKPIIKVDLSVSSGKVPGRNRDDLYEWDLKYPINIPIEVGMSPF